MKKALALILATLTLTCGVTVPALAAENTTFYVAIDGSDEAVGTAEAPFATVQKALEASRAVNGPTVIIFRAGTYEMTETIELTEADSDIVFVADGDVTFKGGHDIPFEAFTQVTDEAILSRLIEESAKDKLMVADLTACGITEYGEIMVNGFSVAPNMSRGFAPTLTYQDRYMTIAEYPNEKQYVYTSEVVSAVDAEGKIAFKVNDERYKQWASRDIWTLGFYQFDWAETLAPLTVDESGVMTTHVAPYYGVTTDRRVKFFNLLEEIDLPGEYYLDRETGKLYMLLPEGFSAGQSLTYSSYDKRFMHINGAKNIELIGLRFEGTTAEGIYVENSDSIHVNDCEFTAIGGTALSIVDCVNCTVENSYFHDLGSKGVVIDCGDREQLIPGNCKVINCHFERFSLYVRTYNQGVNLNGVGNTVSHCEFNDTPHTAVQYNGNDLVIEYCEFYRCCTDTADSGVIYTGRNYTHWGNEIRYNYFHDLEMIATTTGMQMMAVYLDDCHSQTSVYGNFFYHCDSVALYGGGRNNTFENNLMVENKKPFVFDDRGISWGDAAVGQAMANSDQIKWETDIWAAKYPALMNLRNDEPGMPKYNVIRNNVLFDTPEFSLHYWVIQHGTVENNWSTNDYTIFTDYLNNDFTFWESGALQNPVHTRVPDFQPLPFDEMGRYAYTVDLTSYIPAPPETEAPETQAPGTSDTEGEEPSENAPKVQPWIFVAAGIAVAVIVLGVILLTKKK